MSNKTYPDLTCCDEFDPNALNVEQARRKILETVRSVVDIETISIREGLNRVLAENVESTINVPPHINSAMDGYAIAGADIPTTGEKRRMEAIQIKVEKR